MTNQTQNNNPGSFKNNPEKAAEAGRKGGQQSHGGQSHAPSEGTQANRPHQSGESNRTASDRE